MEWNNLIKFAEIIFIPLIGFLWKRIEKSENDLKELKRDIHAHEVLAAEKYATVESVLRLEAKIDELKDLIIAEKMDGYRKRA